MCTGYAEGLGSLGISCLTYISTQCLRIHCVPLKVWNCQIMLSLYTFDWTSSEPLFSSLPHLCSLTPSCLSSLCRFISGASREVLEGFPSNYYIFLLQFIFNFIFIIFFFIFFLPFLRISFCTNTFLSSDTFTFTCTVSNPSLKAIIFLGEI